MDKAITKTNDEIQKSGNEQSALNESYLLTIASCSATVFCETAAVTLSPFSLMFLLWQ